MKNLFLLLFTTFIFQFVSNVLIAQCSSCTITISSIESNLDTIYPGQTICVEANASINDTVVMLGGVICNEGMIDGNLIVYNGVINNYGRIYNDQNVSIPTQAGNVQASTIFMKGALNNYGVVEVTNLATGIDSVKIVNRDSIITNAIAHLKGDVLNESYIKGEQIFFSDSSNVENQGLIYSIANMSIYGEIDNYNLLKSDGNFTSMKRFVNDSIVWVGGQAGFYGNTVNNNKFSIAGNLLNGGNFINNDSVTVMTEFSNTDTLSNYGHFFVEGKFGMSGLEPYFINNHTLNVGQQFGMNGELDNYGDIDVTGLFGVAGVLRNNADATFHVYDEAGSAGTIINHGEFNFEELFENDFNSSFENYGALHFKKNVSNKTSANFLNAGGMHVSGDFDNNGTFSTNCIINVLGDWENQFNGALFGSDTLVGGFAIQGYSSNLSDVAIDNSLFDICDAGSPVGYYDNIGFVAEEGEHVTYCLSNNYCTEQLVTSMNVIDEVQQVQIFPNPLQKGEELTIKNLGNLAWQILDVQGRTVSDSSIGLISTKKWEAGAYFLCLENGRVYKLIIK